MRVKLQPPSGSELPPHNPILPPSAITQVMLIANPAKVSLTSLIVTVNLPKKEAQFWHDCDSSSYECKTSEGLICKKVRINWPALSHWSSFLFHYHKTICLCPFLHLRCWNFVQVGRSRSCVNHCVQFSIKTSYMSKLLIRRSFPFMINISSFSTWNNKSDDFLFCAHEIAVNWLVASVMTQVWHNTVQVWDLTTHVGWVCCWFSSLTTKDFPFSLLRRSTCPKPGVRFVSREIGMWYYCWKKGWSQQQRKALLIFLCCCFFKAATSPSLLVERSAWGPEKWRRTS